MTVEPNRPVIVRRAEAADVERLTPLYVAFFEEDGVPACAAAIRRNLARMIGDARACVFVAEAGGALVGVSSGALTYGVEFGCAAEVDDLYVAPGMRGRGLAKRLASAVLDWAESEGASEILLVITPEAEAAQSLTRFYEKLGFKDSRRILMYRNAPGLADGDARPT